MLIRPHRAAVNGGNTLAHAGALSVHNIPALDHKASHHAVHLRSLWSGPVSRQHANGRSARAPAAPQWRLTLVPPRCQALPGQFRVGHGRGERLSGLYRSEGGRHSRRRPSRRCSGSESSRKPLVLSVDGGGRLNEVLSGCQGRGMKSRDEEWGLDAVESKGGEWGLRRLRSAPFERAVSIFALLDRPPRPCRRSTPGPPSCSRPRPTSRPRTEPSS